MTKTGGGDNRAEMGEQSYLGGTLRPRLRADRIWKVFAH